MPALSTNPLVRRGAAVSLLATVAITGAAGSPADAQPAGEPREVLLVGDAGGGTVSFVDETTFAPLGSLDVIPDLQQRLDQMNVIERIGYEIVRSENGDKFVDDMFVSPDGTTLYVSRSNLPDVVAIDLLTHEQVWRYAVEGFHADHMALSPDGSQIIVSATTADKAHVLDAATGDPVAEFATGSYPHANDYSPDGQFLYNSSIGVISLPQWLEWAKGARQLTVVDPETFEVIATHEFDHGVRPAVFTPDNQTMYAQLSYFNGFIEYDLIAGETVRTVEMPFSEQGAAMDPDDYPGNSAYHGMAMSGDGSKLCMAGTINDQVAIVSLPELTTDHLIDTGSIPYWTQTSVDGGHCYVSLSGDDAVSVISYETGDEVARVPVGDFPQRARNAAVAEEALALLS